MVHPAVEEYLKPMEKPVIVEFMTKAVKLEFRSKQEGRPVYEDQEFVTILIPGTRGTSAHEPVNDEHRARWPKEYAAFKEGKELPLEGTPLANWPNSSMTRSRVEELAFFNVRTVEQLAAVDDAAVQRLGMGAWEMRENARKFLDVAKNGTAPLERLVATNATLTSENVRLTRELTEANAEIRALQARLNERSTDAGT